MENVKIGEKVKKYHGDYTKITINLTEEQKEKIKKEILKKNDVSLQLSLKNIKGDASVFLHAYQLREMKEAFEKGGDFKLNLSISQMRMIIKDNNY